ncbi:hypothetical protein ABIB25_003400 [Nakamurella sp. UYEF19]|uniref:hypothetical protein n=1 Tax=Nakamurella sp. UYEF19 TaxID=1756392 RepID=UPI003391905F
MSTSAESVGRPADRTTGTVDTTTGTPGTPSAKPEASAGAPGAQNATGSRRPTGLTADVAASALRERIYGSISCLSTLLVITGNQELDHPWEKLVDVLVATGGLWAASVLAEFVAHIGAHQSMPGIKSVRHMFWVSGQIMAASALPLLFLVLSGLGLLTVHTAVWLGVWVLVAEMGVFAFLAVRSASLRWWATTLLVVAIMLLGVLVVFLKTLAH